MLFNSYTFIFLFLPATVAGFFAFSRASRPLALGWLIFASIFFYAWWNPINVLIMAPSIFINYVLARLLLRLREDEQTLFAARAVLVAGLAFNVMFLGYFKYINFLRTASNDILGTDFALMNVILPLGISFITFQKIAFLVDVAGGRVRSFTLRDYLLFVLFFPQLIAGPIVHFREMIPQFNQMECRVDATRFAAALTLFCFGLFKKVVLADGIAPHVSPVYAAAAAGMPVGLLQAWLAAVGFTLQIYFDFSGYSDMACGIALFFGVRLPMNFNSPLKATNIIDYWLRWHITLTRFLTAYVYNPIALALSRRRAARNQAMLRSHGSDKSAFFLLLAGPTLATMLLSGIWHGAGYTFIVWGLMHGIYLIINHTWRQYGPPPGKGSLASSPYAGLAVTFVAVVVAMIFFRSPDLASAANVLKGIVGAHGLGLPHGGDGAPGLGTLAKGIAYCGILLAIALFLPNSLEVMSKYDPALQYSKQPPQVAGWGPCLYWHPTLPWMVLIAVLAGLSITRLTGKSEFLYWQF
jgi:D-alanyl-lipoteichoic acid acyltransferase DltB (MBOAT superfamily)